MVNKILKLNIQILSNEITNLKISESKQDKMITRNEIQVDGVLKNQELLFMQLKKLSDCFQLEYQDGKYISKKNGNRRIKTR